jgi:hypothetical protein
MLPICNLNAIPYNSSGSLIQKLQPILYIDPFRQSIQFLSLRFWPASDIFFHRIHDSQEIMELDKYWPMDSHQTDIYIPEVGSGAQEEKASPVDQSHPPWALLIDQINGSPRSQYIYRCIKNGNSWYETYHTAFV